MQISNRRITCALAFAACALSLPATAGAAPVIADLRVEAGGKTLVPGTSFVTDTTSVKTDTSTPACNGTGQTKRLAGPTATGLLVDASAAVGSLRPIGISDQFDFGLLVCGIGEYAATDTAFFLYKVDHKEAEVGGEQFKLEGGEEVLWYRQDTVSGANTGDELDIIAPARARAGQPFTATVVAYAGNGARKAAPGATLKFPGGTATTDAAGKARVTVRKETGAAKLSASRAKDISSGTTPVCIGEQLSDCSPRRGKRILGRRRGDPIEGTRGPDVILAAGGADTIDVRGGGVDRVNCGKGRDSVKAGPGDRVARNCERVIREPATGKRG